GALLLGLQRLHRAAQPLHRPHELHSPVGQRRVPADLPERLRLHRHLDRLQARARHLAGPAAQPPALVQAPDPRGRPPAVGHPEGALRSGPGRRRRAVVALLVRHAADAEAGPGRGRPVLDHLHVQRLQHRVRAHPRRAHQHHPPVRDVLAHDRAGERPHRRGRGDLAVPVPAADVRGVGAAALRAQTGLLMSRRTLGTNVLMHVLLVPFLIFALFPFYHMLLTSLKQDRELYDRFAVPLLIKQGPTLEHYTKLLWETEFLTWTKNSLMVTV